MLKYHTETFQDGDTSAKEQFEGWLNNNYHAESNTIIGIEDNQEWTPDGGFFLKLVNVIKVKMIVDMSLIPGDGIETSDDNTLRVDKDYLKAICVRASYALSDLPDKPTPEQFDKIESMWRDEISSAFKHIIEIDMDFFMDIFLRVYPELIKANAREDTEGVLIKEVMLAFEYEEA